MEIEDLKTLLEKKASRSLTTFSFETKHLSEFVSVSVMTRVLRNLNWEIAFALLFGLAALTMCCSAHNVPVIIFLSLLTVYSLSFAYYLLKLKVRMTNHINTLKSVRDYVADSIDILERFIRLYKRLATGFVPSVFLAAFVAGLAGFIIENNHRVQLPYLAIAVCLPFVIGWVYLMRKLTDWYLNRLYGHHIKDLRLQLLELSE